MSRVNVGGLPGIGAKVSTVEKQIWWGHENLRIYSPLPVIGSAAVDSGNTPTTNLRSGLVMAMKDSDSLWYPYDPTATDGTEYARGVLQDALPMINPSSGVVENKRGVILIGGLLQYSQLLNLDTLARKHLSRRFVFDDDPGGKGRFLMQKRTIRKGADYSVLSTDDEALFIATAAVNFTLPTKVSGLRFRFLQTADANMVITGSSDIVADGSIANSSVTFGTSSHKKGSHILVECVLTAASTLKWVVSNLGGTTMTLA